MVSAGNCRAAAAAGARSARSGTSARARSSSTRSSSGRPLSSIKGETRPRPVIRYLSTVTNPNRCNSKGRRIKNGKEEISGQHLGSADDGKAKFAGEPVDGRNRCQNHQHDKGDLIKIVGSDLLGQLKAEPAGAGDTDDRRRSRIRLEIIEYLAGDHWQDLWQEAEAHRHPCAPAARDDGFALARLRGFKRFRKEACRRRRCPTPPLPGCRRTARARRRRRIPAPRSAYRRREWCRACG